MYLGFDYNFALGRQAELIRWAENQRKIKQLRWSHHHPEPAVLVDGDLPGADPEAAWPIEDEGPGQRQAS